MFYQPRDGHGLPHNPFLAIVAPRPIGWISTVSEDGVVNLAPYSFFNAVAGSPPMVMFSSEGIKDSIRNVMATGEFVVNLATRALADRMNITAIAVAPAVNEFDTSGLTAAPCHLVRPPRVAESPAALECRLTSLVPLPDLQGNTGERMMAVGEVVGIHIDPGALTDGAFDMVKVGTLARCGYWDYQVTTAVFSMPRPDHPDPH